MAHPDFNPPGEPPKLTGRRSTITGLFFTSLTPYIEPTDDEVDQVLFLLGMTRGNTQCAYCGDAKTEWDHFEAVVRDRKPTGYITEIANLVPSCGKCNQSKGNKPWRTWMLGGANLSPATRGKVDVMERAKRLGAFEEWAQPQRQKIEYQALIGVHKWKQHTQYLEEILLLLEAAEVHAVELRETAKRAIEKKAKPDL